MVFRTRVFALLLCFLVVVGCTAQQPVEDPSHAELRMLPGRFADEPVTKPLTAVEAYIGNEEFFVAYEIDVANAGHRTFVDFKNKIDPVLIEFAHLRRDLRSKAAGAPIHFNDPLHVRLRACRGED